MLDSHRFAERDQVDSACLCAIAGQIIATPEGPSLQCQADGCGFPLGFLGKTITLPFPTGAWCWWVLPKTDSTGQVSALQAWDYEAIDPNLSAEVWQLSGCVEQISPRNRLIQLAVKTGIAQKSIIRVTLHVDRPDDFQLGGSWRFQIERRGEQLHSMTAQPLAPTSPETSTQANVNPSSVEAPKPGASGPSLTSTSSIPAGLQSQIQAILATATGLENWSLQDPVQRRDLHWQKMVWELMATRDRQTVRVKLTEDGRRHALYHLPSPPTQVHPEIHPEVQSDRLSVTPLGAARSIGASCFRVLIGPYEVVLDAGTRPKGQNPLPAFEQLQAPDLLLISHAHQDHLGALPVFHSLFPGAPMISTPGTRQLAQVMLSDGLKVQQRNEDAEPLFDAEELERSLFRLQTQSFNQDFEPLPGLMVRLIPAGHIVGAACIYLRYGARSLVYTGDYNLTSSRTTEGLKIQDLPPADMLITESTYGNVLHPSRKQQERELMTAVMAVVKQGGNVLIPAFALGRAQELILALRQNAEFCNLGVPVYVDGLVRSVTDCFRTHLDLLPDSVQRYAQTQEPFFNPARPQVVAIARPADRPLAMAHPSVIIASSGMLNGGASVYYAKVLLERQNAALFISGYTDEESPGRRVQALETGSEIELDGTMVTVRAQVQRFSLSAHADKAGICQVIERVSPKHLILIHGGREALHDLSRTSNLQNKYLIHIPAVGEVIAYETVPEHVSLSRLQQINLPETFEVTVEAEQQGAWLWVPEAVTDGDPRWDKLAGYGVMQAKWVGDHRLMLTPVVPARGRSQSLISADNPCCASCEYGRDRHCTCVESALYGQQIDPTGRCPEFQARGGNDLDFADDTLTDQ
jgi:Cft2 family RNA processing exonuclease